MCRHMPKMFPQIYLIGKCNPTFLSKIKKKKVYKFLNLQMECSVSPCPKQMVLSFIIRHVAQPEKGTGKSSVFIVLHIVFHLK